MFIMYKQFPEALGGRFPAEDFSGALVEHFLISGELLVRDFGEVGAFGQVMADAAVLALARAAFPRAVGVAEEDLEAEVSGEDFVLGHLFALIISEAVTQGHRDESQAAGEGFAHAGGVLFGQVAQHGETRRALHEHADRRAIARAQNQVALVVSGNEAIFDLGGAFIDEHHVRDLTLSGGGAPSPHLARAVGSPQAFGQFAFQFAAGDQVNVAVDRFVRGVHVGDLRILALERARDFLRRPASAEVGMHRVAQRRGLVNFTVASAHPRLALSGRKMRGLGTVGLAPTVALQLGADRARRAPQPLRHGALGEPGEQSNLDLNAFRQTQNRVRHRFGLGGRIIKSNQRARSGTAEPVPDRALWAKSTPCLNTTRRRCCSIYRRVVQIRHSNSSLSAPPKK